MSRLIRRIFDRNSRSRRPYGLTAARSIRTAAELKARLLLQTLEDRLVPANFIVNSIGDAGAGANNTGDLRYCITQSNATPGPNTIDATGVSGTITLTATLPTIAAGHDLTITGAGASQLTIDGGDIFQILVDSASNFSISGVTLANGVTPNNGGAIQMKAANENLTVTNSVITGCFAGNLGGGIYHLDGGSVTISGTTFSNNASDVGGGAIAMDFLGTNPAPLTVTKSQFINNDADLTGTGGAIWFIRAGSLSISNSSLSGNSAGDNGGALAISLYSSPMIVSNCTLSGNTACTGSAISIAGGSVPLNITCSTITGNTAITSTNVLVASQYGAICSYAAATIALDNTIVSGNYASNNNTPDIVSPNGSVSAKYSALGTSIGYSLINQGGNLTGASASPLALGLGALAPFSGPNGTFLMAPIKHSGTANDAGDPTLAGTTDERGLSRPQESNIAINPSLQPDIGALELGPGPDATLSSAPAVTTSGGTNYQFAVTYGDLVAINTASLGSANVTVTTPAGVAPVTVAYVGVNTSNPNDVVATYQFTPPGGSWSYTDDGTYTVNMQPNQVMDANGTVTAGALGTFQSVIPQTFTVTNTGDVGTGSGNGGDLRYCITQANLDAALGLLDTIVFSNTTSGGATNFSDGGRYTIDLGSALPTIIDPLAIIGPGANALTVSGDNIGFTDFTTNPAAGTTIFMSGMTVTGGVAPGTAGDGGGFDEAGGNLTLSGMTIQGNTATGHGGGVADDSAGTLTISNSTIQNNSSGGGGIYNAASAPMTLTGDTISGNTGGGLDFAGSGSLTITNTTFANNTGTGGAGMLLFLGISGSVDIADSTISANSATNGGGIEVTGSVGADFTISNCTIANNDATNGGGIAFVNLNTAASTINLVNDTITGNTAGNANAIPGLGGGGIDLASVSSSSGSVSATITLDNSIVSGNSAANGYNDISTAPAPSSSVAVTFSAKYSALGNDPGYTLTNLGNNLIGYNLLLGGLGSNGGLTETVPLLAASPAIGVGDPNQNGTTDQRGVTRPQGMGPMARPDVGAYERSADTIGASANVSNVSSVSAPATYQFTVTYADDVPISTGSISASNVTIAPPSGVTVPTVSLVGVNSSNPNKVLATYQFTAPGGAWTGADDGTYTVNMAPNQVTEANGPVPAGALATFQASAPTTFTVTSTADTTSAGTLRAAITAADAIAPNPAIIVFSNSTAGGATNFYAGTVHTINLGSILPTVANTMTITGPGSAYLTINGAGGTFQMLAINPGTSAAGTYADSLSGITLSGAKTTAAGAGIADTNSAALTLTDVTVKNNSTSGSAGGINVATSGTVLVITNSTIQANTAGAGGGGVTLATGGQSTISNSMITANRVTGRGGGMLLTGGSLTVAQSTISNNSSTGAGGGIAAGISAAASLLISQSTLSGNTAAATNGGGAMYFSGAVGSLGVTVVNSTITKNTAVSGGGLVAHALSGTINITNSTITGNSATTTSATAGLGGGGIALTSASTAPGASSIINLDNTIVSGNNAANGRGDIAATATGTSISVAAAYSAIGSSTGFTLTNNGHNLAYGANLALGSLGSNGGPTQTVALGSSSAAINTGDPSTALTTDQRGYARVYGPAQDIGAYEVQPFTVAGVVVSDGIAADGTTQRSEARQIAITFSGPVTFAGGNAAAAFQLEHLTDSNDVTLSAAVSTNAANDTVVTLTFSGAETDPVSALNGGQPSLADGRYQLTVLAADVSGPDGLVLNGGTNYNSPADTYNPTTGTTTGLGLYRLFGDATGNGIVDAQDLGPFRTTYNVGVGNSLYLAYLDADNSGFVDSQDLGQFRTRYNTSVYN